MHYIRVGSAIADDADKVKFSQNPKNGNMRILIIGDSTIVGTGSDDPEKSLAGLVGKTFPKAEVVNRGVNGRKTKNLREEIERLDESYDIIMLHTGGNDVVRFTNYKELEVDVRALLVSAKENSDKVTLVTSGEVGTAPLLPLGTRWIFTKRYLKIREIFKRVAEENGVEYVDLYREKKEDLFYLEPDKYYSPDYFHPSSDGYALWYERIEPVLIKINSEN